MQQVVPSLPGQFEARKQRFSEILETYGAALRTTLRRICRDADDADDVFQETALRVWKNLDRTPRIRSPRGWLITIGYRVVIDRRSRRPAPRPLDDELLEAPDRTPPETLEHSESLDRATALVQELPEALRDVMVLHYGGGLSLRKTAEVMGLPAGTVKSRLNQALGKLREAMK